jgi:hypothetical protein
MQVKHHRCSSVLAHHTPTKVPELCLPFIFPNYIYNGCALLAYVQLSGTVHLPHIKKNYYVATDTLQCEPLNPTYGY